MSCKSKKEKIQADTHIYTYVLYLSMQEPVHGASFPCFISSNTQLEVMDEGLKDMFHGPSLPRIEDGNELRESSSFYGDSGDSTFSSSALDVSDDATSSSLDSSSASSNTSRLDSRGPLFELSSLMAELPIKRGLSKYFQGKSQSFSSLSDARCVKDLAKKKTPYRKKMKTWKSSAGGLDARQRPCFTPGSCRKTIAKKSSRGSCASLLARRSST